MDFYKRSKLYLSKHLSLNRYRLETLIYNAKTALFPTRHIEPQKCLYASAVGEYGKKYLEKIIRRFGYKYFDYLIFCYDNTSFNEPIFDRCQFIVEPGIKWYFAKKYLTPEKCRNYRYIFFWDEDLDILDFSPEEFLKIMRQNRLQLAQPSLSGDSFFSHTITLANTRYKVGRYTDFVEVMAQIFDVDIWIKFWAYIEADWNFWGWGYDLIMRDACGLSNMAIVDSQSVRHTKPVTSQHYGARAEMLRYFAKYPSVKRARFISYYKLHDYKRRLDKIAAL
jgi:hypothetical protein